MRPADAQRIRLEWCSQLSDNVIKTLAPAAAIESFQASHDRQLFAGMLLYVASRECVGFSPEDSAAHLARTGLFGERDAEWLLTEVVMPVIGRLRTNRLPGPRWWDVVGLDVHVMNIWAASQRPIMDDAALGSELHRLWDISNPGVLADALRIQLDPYEHWPRNPDESLAGLVPAQSTQAGPGLGEQPTASGESRYDALTRLGRPDLAELHRLATAVELGAEIVGLLGRTVESLTPLEVELMSGPEESEAEARYLNGAVHVAYFYMSLPDALPSGTDVQSGVLAPGWMQSLIMEAGARQWHGSAGPIPIWLCTAETEGDAALIHDAIRRGRLGVSLRTTQDAVCLSLVVRTSDDSLVVEYIYDVRYASEAWEALLLAAVGRVRFVLLVISPDEQLKAVATMTLTMADAHIVALRSEMVAHPRGMCDDDLTVLRGRIVEENGETPLSILAACERAKGEELLIELMPTDQADGESSVGAPVLAASRAVAAAHALRIRTGDDRGVEHAVSQRLLAVQHARSMLKQRPADSEPIDVLPDEQTAFVHFYTKADSFTGSRDILRAMWVAPGRPRPRAAMPGHGLTATAPFVELLAEAERANPRTRRALLNELHALLGDIGSSVADALRPLGIRRLIISPVRPFDQLPLHAAPVDGSRTLVDVFDEVTYAPSLRVLSAARRTRSPRRGPDSVVIAAHGVNLAGAQAEVALLRQLYPQASVLQAADATLAKVLRTLRTATLLHVACHSRFTEDRWANSLELAASDDGSDGSLTVADVLASPFFPQLRLVTLNSCRSGVHRDAGYGLHSPRGLDAAFFARGANAVVSTLWEVGDITSFAFGTALHLALRRGATAAAAYRHAVEFIRHGGSDDGTNAYAEERIILGAHPGWPEALRASAGEGAWNWTSFKLLGCGWD